MKRRRQRTVVVAGLLLKVDGRFVGWDSFKKRWKLGPRRLSEVFAWHPLNPSARLLEAQALFPTAEVVYERGE